MLRILASDDRARESRRNHASTSTALISSRQTEPPTRFNPLANIAAIGFHGGEAPKAVGGSQFPLFKMLANLFNSYFAPAVLAGPSVNMGQQSGSRMARGLRVGVLPDCSNHLFPIDPTAAPVLFRPAKLPDIRTLLASCLNDTSELLE